MFLLWPFNICLLPFSSGFKGFDLFLMSELRITFSMAIDFVWCMELF
jgi:hypothetical protein